MSRDYGHRACVSIPHPQPLAASLHKSHCARTARCRSLSWKENRLGTFPLYTSLNTAQFTPQISGERSGKANVEYTQDDSARVLSHAIQLKENIINMHVLLISTRRLVSSNVRAYTPERRPNIKKSIVIRRH